MVRPPRGPPSRRWRVSAGVSQTTEQATVEWLMFLHFTVGHVFYPWVKHPCMGLLRKAFCYPGSGHLPRLISYLLPPRLPISLRSPITKRISVRLWAASASSEDAVALLAMEPEFDGPTL